MSLVADVLVWLAEAWDWLRQGVPGVDPDSLLNDVIAGLVVAAIVGVISATGAALVRLIRLGTRRGPAVGTASASSAPDSPDAAPDRPRVFISYAHEDEAHRSRVLELAQRLRRDGVDARLDRFDAHQSDWSVWMEREVQAADAVLCVCTATWRHRFDLEEDDATDTGVRYEARLIRGLVKQRRGRMHSVAAVAFRQDDLDHHVPLVLQDGTPYLLDDHYEKLYGWLTGQAGEEPARLGSLRAIEPKSEGAHELWALEVFRRSLRARLDTLPSVFQRHGRRVLTDVYVEVEVADADGASLDDRVGRHGGRMALPDVLALDHDRWALKGEPGSGKSTLLRRLAIALLDAPSGPLPMFLRIAELPKQGGLRAALEDDEVHAPAADQLLERLNAGQGVLLLDGLDEHPEPERARKLVASLAEEAAPSKVIIASRDVGYERPTGAFWDLPLCPLDDEAQRALLLRWVDDEDQVDTTLRSLSGSHRLRRMLENPLLLTLVGLVLLDGGEPPRRRSELYRRAVDFLVQRSYAPGDGLRARGVATEALGVLALALHGDEGTVTREREIARVLRGHAELRSEWGDIEAFLRDVAAKTELLVPWPSAQEVQGYLFPHRSLREFLAAEALAADIESHGGVGDVPEEALQAAIQGRRTEGLAPASGALGQVLARAIEQPQTWSEVLALTCGLLGEGAADQLVRRVAAEGSGELVARLVSEAEAIGPETVLAALGAEGGQEQWEARRDLLQQLPELIGDAALVMGLLRRFATGTTHGADLWWAHHLLEQLGEGVCGELPVEKPVRDEAADLARRFWHGHRPAERDQALRALERWGWRGIPEGSFRMGSPEGEGNDDERPQHEVRVRSGFGMLAVPVTNAVYEAFDPGHEADRVTAFGDDLDEHPVVNVTWYEAAAFAAWLTAGDPRHTIRLPVEIEWEYGCRAGTSTQYWSGDREENLARVGWYDGNSDNRTHPVGRPPGPDAPAHPHGLHDLHGNADEWCADVWDANRYATQAEQQPFPHDPQAEVPTEGDPGAWRVIRGGSFDGVADIARSAFRLHWFPGGRDRDLGFRLVRVPAPQRGSGS